MAGTRGKIVTVAGAIEPGELGVTLTHEHLLIDMNATYVASTPENADYSRLPVTIENLGRIRRDPLNNADNTRLYDRAEAVRELGRYREAGGSSVVDATVRGLNPDNSGLVEVANASGVRIVSATGYYIASSLSPEMRSWSVEELAAPMRRDIEGGFGGTEVRAGIIKIGAAGLVDGDTMDIHPVEKRTLQAAAAVQRETGVAITIHTPRHHLRQPDKPPSYWGLRILDILEEAGAAPDHVAIGHLDRCAHENLDFLLEIAARGAFVQYDAFGKECEYYPNAKEEALPDAIRIERLIELIDAGLLEKLLLSQDVCMKIERTAYGGYGYGHILRNIVPILRDEGISESNVHAMVRDNPRRLLTVR